MKELNKKEPWTLFLGDMFILVASLWLALAFRYIEIPTNEVWKNHFFSFSYLILTWLLVFYISGLYEKHTLILKNNLPATLFKTLVFNGLLAISFFYFVPHFQISPKTILFIYLVLSFGLILLWRLKLIKYFSPRKKQNAILIGSGEEMKELRHEVNNNSRYDFQFIQSINLDQYDTQNFNEDVVKTVYENNDSLIVADIKNNNAGAIIPNLYNLIFAKVQFIDTYKMYEMIFDRIPLSMIGYNWFLENISSKKLITYDFSKRLIDLIFSLMLFMATLPFYILVYVLIKLDDGGSIFFYQSRVGKNNKIFNIIKFRTYNEVEKFEDKKLTRIGKFLRVTRIDELPQLINVLKGEISLIGPRPETSQYVELYSKQVPYYNIRHLIKPGLSGWAQIYHDNHPHHEADVDATKQKLSYDLFYIKNRSIILDIKIALKTINTILSQKGR